MYEIVLFRTNSTKCEKHPENTIVIGYLNVQIVILSYLCKNGIAEIIYEIILNLYEEDGDGIS